MFGIDRMSPAAVAAGLVVLAALVGCGGEPSVASRSAAAFQEAQKKGETFEGSGHSHGGHEAATPEAEAGHEGHGTHGAHGADPGVAEGSADDHSAMGHGSDHQASGQAGQEGHAEQEGHAGHAGHGAPPSASPAAPEAHESHGAHDAHGAEPQPEASGAGHADHAGHAGHTDQADPAGHAGHAPSPAGAPDTPAPAAEVPSPGQPASTLRPDALDAPAATSVIDALRSLKMAGDHGGPDGHGEPGGHGAHGVARYRHVDVGRGPAAFDERDVPPPPAAGTQQHLEQHQHQHPAEEPAAPAPTTAGYTCPMHPEVVSETPGTCPKCGMALVPRKGEE